MAANRKKKAPAPDSGPIVKNGWTLFAHGLLLEQITQLRTQIAARPTAPGPKKVLAWLVNAIFDKIPDDPTLAAYRQGGTLGNSYKHWFRDKYKGRFRLFFRYDSRSKVIVFAWVNDENTLRTRGAKTDAYAVFARMLGCGNPPDDWDALVKSASDPKNVARSKKVLGAQS